MYSKIQNQIENTINEIKEAGHYKNKRVIESPQKVHIKVAAGEVLDWYKRQGAGYQTKINGLLHSYMEAHDS